MFIVQLLKQYQPKDASGNAQTSLNAGEFAGFSRKEYEFIIADRPSGKIGLPAKSVRMLKPVDRKVARQVLGKSWEPRKGARIGQALTLLADRADKLIKDGMAEELFAMITTAPHKDHKGTLRDSGTFVATKKEIEEHVKNGTAEAYVNPADELEDEDPDLEEQRMVDRAAEARSGSR